MRRQAREVRKRHRRIAELRAEHARFLMRQLQKVIEDTELVHHFERRRMNRVAAEVAQKISVLLEHENVDPGPREQKREHHPGGSATRDTAARGELFHGDSVSPPEVAVEMTDVDAGGALVSSSEARHFQRSSQSSRTAEASEKWQRREEPDCSWCGRTSIRSTRRSSTAGTTKNISTACSAFPAS